MSTRRYSSEYKALRPFIIEEIRGILGGSVAVAGAVGGIASHALNDTSIHTGQLAQMQAPWASTKSELAAHAADPNAHHAKQHVLATNTGLGPDHTVSGAVAGWVLRATASNAARMAQLLVTDLGAAGANWDVAALTAANTVGLRTPSSDVRTGAAEALLKSNAAGELGLKGLVVGAAMILSGSGNIAAYPDIQFTGDALLAAEGSLYVSLDSDNNLASGAALIVGHNSDTTTGFAELLRFTDTGRLGIGQPSPAYALDVTGSARLTTSLLAPLLTTAVGDMTVAPAQSIWLTPGASNRLYLSDGKAFRTADFATGFAGYGFQLDQGITTADKTTLMLDDLTVRGRMSVYELLIRQIRATNGAVFVTSTAKVKQVWTVPGGYGLSTLEPDETPSAPTDHTHGFLAGDLLRAQRTRWNGTQLVEIYRCDLRVTTVDSMYAFRAVLVSGNAPEPGMEFVRIGSQSDANRRGSLYLTADDDSAPYMDVVDGIAAHSDWNTPGKIKVRIGKLTGITTQANEYGLIAGAGGFADANQWIKASSLGVKLNNTEIRTWSTGVNTGVWNADGQLHIGFDGVGTAAERDFTITLNALRIGRETTNYPNLLYSKGGGYVALRSGAVDKIRLDSNGDSYFAGVMTIGAAGEIRQGTGALGSDYTGLRIWRESNVGRIAGYNANALQWYADTDGRFKAGGGAVVIDATGMWLQVALAQHKLRFMDGTATLGYVEGFADLNHNLRIAVGENSGKGGSFVMQAYNGASTLLASLGVGASGVTVTGDLRLSSGFLRSSAAFAFTDLAGTVYQDITVKNLSLTNNGIYGTAAIAFLNLAGTAYQDITVKNLSLTNNGIYGTAAIAFLTAASAAQSVYAGGLLVSSAYAAHASRVPTNGIYSLGGITTSGGISSYADDLYIARAGVSKLGLFAWGTYAYGSFTLDDILAINNVLTVEPAAPATGAKLYLINRSGNVYLEVKFANGKVKQPANNL